MTAPEHGPDGATAGWIPIANGEFYCSPRCAGGKFCKREWYDRAKSQTAVMLAELGPGWSDGTFENLGWHARAVLKPGGAANGHGPLGHVSTEGGGQGGYTAYFEGSVQHIARADTAADAWGFALQDARSYISRLEAELKSVSEAEDAARASDPRVQPSLAQSADAQQGGGGAS